MSEHNLIEDFRLILEKIRSDFVQFLPNLILAIGVFLFGLALAFILRFTIRRLIQGIDKMIPPDSFGGKLKLLGMRKPAANWIGKIVFWMVVVVFLTISTEVAGLKVITVWLGGLGTYLPKILAAVLIGFVGYLSAGLIRDLVIKTTSSAGLMYGALLGKATYVAIVLVTLLIAIGQTGIDVQFLTISLLIFLAAVLIGGALAFALGARTIVSNILSSYYLQKNYRVGQHIKVSDQEGKIIEINSTSVVLETHEGKTLIPAKTFSEVMSVALTS